MLTINYKTSCIAEIYKKKKIANTEYMVYLLLNHKYFIEY